MTKHRTAIEYEETQDGWRATEGAADHDVWGEGDTPHDAVIDYVETVRDRPACPSCGKPARSAEGIVDLFECPECNRCCDEDGRPVSA